MGVVIFDSATVTAEIALSSAAGPCGVWGGGLWDTDLWGPDETWVDVSDYLRSVETARRFSRDLQVWEAGTATVVLDNRDGRFSSDNLSGPYVVGGVSSVRPRRPIRITAAYAGITYPIYAGVIRSWKEGWAKAAAGRGDAIVTVRCVDLWGLLAGNDPIAQASQGAGDLFGPRVNRVLDAAEHAGPRDIASGTVTMQATTLSSRSTAELLLTAESEGGAVWVAADGTVMARNRAAIIEETRSAVVQATFGDAAGEVPYQAVEPDEDDTLLANYVAWARVGGAQQIAADATSRALYQTTRSERSDLICETDDQVDVLAWWYLALHKDIERLIKSVTVSPRRSDTGYPTVLGLCERDLVLVKRQHPGGHTVSRHCHISGIRHKITKKPSRWDVTYEMQSATVLYRYAGSLWDSGVWGSSGTDPDASLWFY